MCSSDALDGSYHWHEHPVCHSVSMTWISHPATSGAMGACLLMADIVAIVDRISGKSEYTTLYQ
jgi:hypothetical protein